MRGTASDRAISSSAAFRQIAPTASDKLQRKLYRQNKRLKRWALEEDISCSAVDAVLGSETSDEVFREESTPRADQPANIAQPVIGTRQHPPPISTKTLEQVKPARRVMTPMCSAFLSAAASSSRVGLVHATNQNVEAKVAAPGSTRARRGSLQSDGPALRSAVRSALSGSCRVSTADEAPPRCHSPSTVNPSSSAASSTSSMSTGNCSSTSESRPWRPIRRLSNASQMILQSPAACKPAVAAPGHLLNDCMSTTACMLGRQSN